jgi:hypothetical protein
VNTRAKLAASKQPVEELASAGDESDNVTRKPTDETGALPF